MWAYECPVHCRWGGTYKHRGCGEPTYGLVFDKIPGQGVVSYTVCKAHYGPDIVRVTPVEPWYDNKRIYDRPGPKTCECSNPDEFARGRY